MPNEDLSNEMKQMARNFGQECTDKAWEAEIYAFGENEIIRWATNQEIMISHLRELINFYAKSSLF